MESCMNQTNGDWEAMISTAESLFKKKNYKKALKAFMSICEVGDAKRVDQVWKLVMKCCKGFALDQKQLIARLEELFELSPKNYDIAFQIGEEYQIMEQFDRAESWLRRAIEINPQFKKAYFKINYVLYQQQKIDQILPTLLLCDKNIPNDKKVIIQVCNVAQAAKINEKAAEFYEKLILLKPTNINYYLSYVENDIQSPYDYHIQKCWTYIEKASQLSKMQGIRQTYLKGLILTKEGKYSDAYSMFQGVLKKNPRHLNCLVKLCMLYNNSKMHDAAIQCLECFRFLHPNNLSYENLLAYSYWMAQDFQSCVKTVDMMCTSDFEKADNFLWMVSEVLRYSGKLEQAIQYCSSYLTQYHDKQQKLKVYESLYRCFLMQGNKQKAVEYLILIRNSNNMDVLLSTQLAKLCLEIGKVELCYTIIEELEHILGILSLNDKVYVLRLLQKANQLDRCLQIYDTHLVVSKAKLDLSSLLELYLTLAECHRKLGNIGGVIEIVVEIEALLERKDIEWPTSQIVDFIETQLYLFNYKRVETLYQLLKKQVESRQINGYRWESVLFASEMGRFESVLKQQLEEATPQ